MSRLILSSITGVALLGAAAVAGPAFANDDEDVCEGLPSHSELKAALTEVVDAGGNAGLANEMWATLVNRDGTVCAVARSGSQGDQWPGSRVISAQKANTANAFSLPGLALSTQQNQSRW